MKPMHKQSGLPIPGIVHVDQPYWFGSDQSMSPDDFGIATARAIEDKIKEIGADKVAAFIGEPIQGAGGVIVPPDSYWPEVQRICDEYGILLISDEVITGFGRLGEWFGADYYGTRPDFMPFAKGVTSGYLPLGGVFISDRVADVLVDKAGEFAHGYTYSGHPVACAVAIGNLKILQRENLVERIRDDIGPYKIIRSSATHAWSASWARSSSSSRRSHWNDLMRSRALVALPATCSSRTVCAFALPAIRLFARRLSRFRTARLIRSSRSRARFLT
jgi:putrescine aminotransferase